MYFSGQHGQLLIADRNAGDANFSAVCAVRNWSYTIQQQVLETTSLAKTDRTLIPGVRSTSGTASIFYYSEPNSNVDSFAKYLVDTLPASGADADACWFGENDPPTLCKLRLDLNPSSGAANTRDKIEMFAYITSFAMTCSVGEVVSADISFEGHGAPRHFNYP